VLAKSAINCPAKARAKRLVIDLATNCHDPESFVSHREAVDPDSNLEETYRMIRRAGQAVRFAFETSNAYERDWFLLWARVENAAAQMKLGREASVSSSGAVGPTDMSKQPWIPIAEGSQIDQCVSFVQRKLAKKMAVCAWKDCKGYFFKGPGRSKYCSKRCSKAKINAGNLRYWNRVGRVKRKARAAIIRLADRPI
jgi:hypothetical protein